MSKPYQLSLTLILTLALLSGCHGMQPPSKDQTVTSPGTYGPAYVPPGRTGLGQPIDPEELNKINAGLTTRGDNLLGNFDFNNPPADMILVSIYFDYDQFNIRTEDRKLLETTAKALAADPTARVVAVGHCDWHGSDQYNLALSEKRANSVKAYLTKDGANADQEAILPEGEYGATPDVAKDSSQAKHDRRVDVVKIPAGATLPSGPPSTTTDVVPTAVTK